MLETLTFARTRRAANSIRWLRPVLRVAPWWALSFLTLAIYASLRGRMDDLGFPVHGSELGTGLLGTEPTVWLQHHVYTLAPSTLEWIAVVVHASWFFVPPIAALFVTWRRPDRVGSFFRWWISLQALALVCFALFPTRPPWMEDGNVIRVVALSQGGTIQDSNSLAAMPSLHVAFPLIISVWFFRERWKLPGILMGAYSALIAVEVIFSGEHYPVDVLGSGIIVAAIAFASRLNFGFFVQSLREHEEVEGPARDSGSGRRTVGRALRNERGQAVIELALVLPLLFVFTYMIVEFGIALEHSLNYADAAREGARAAATGSSVAQVQTTVQNSGGCTLSSSCTIQVTYMDGTGNGVVGEVGDRVQVRITEDYPFVTPLGSLLSVFGASQPTLQLGSCAEMRQEQVVTATTGTSLCQ